MGIEVVEFDFAVNFFYGGRYNDGHTIRDKGRYLAHITVAPRRLNVKWGFHMKAQVEIPTVLNAGTRENPVSRAVLNLNMQYGSIIFEERMQVTWQIDGDGKFVRIN